MAQQVSRKRANELINNIYDSFHFGLMSLTDSGIENSWEREYFWTEANRVDQGRLTKEYEQTVNSLDAAGFNEYYKYIGKFASTYKIGNWEEYNQYEPILIENLNEELGKYEQTEDKLDLIDSFSAEELQSESFMFESKVQLLYDILDDFRVGDNKEKGINKVLSSFNSGDKLGFISKIQSDGKLLNSLVNKVNGTEKDEMFALIGEIFISSGFIKDQKAVLLNNKKTDKVTATYEKGNVFIDVKSPVSGGVRDYATTKTKSITASPFDIIGLNYDGKEIRVPALLLLNSWSNSGATPEGIFFNYQDEDVDWNTLDDKQKDEYFYKFVAHYLPSGFVEALGSPLQMVITSLITVGLAIATGGASAIAELEVVLAASGLALTGVSVYGSIRGIMVANDMKKSATTMHEAKKAAKVMAENVAQLSLNVVDLIFTSKDLIKARVKNSTAVTDGIKMSPEEILREAGYKRQSLMDKSIPTIEKLQIEIPDDELIKILAKMKKKGLENSIDNVNKILDVIEKIDVPNRSLVINNAESIRELKKYYTTQEITDYLNKTNTENLKDTIKTLKQTQKKLLSKNISSGESNKFAREFLTELELKHGISKERLDVLRNLEYDKMTKDDYEKLKPEIDAIINLTKSYDLNKKKPGVMRKYISLEKMNEYLSNGKQSKTIGGFIARQDDVLHLETFDDVFYTMRLDYEGNSFIFDKEIAYIDFIAEDYTNTYVPIGTTYGGSVDLSQPFGGLGLLKTENGQIIREYKTKGDGLNILEAVMYKIDKNTKEPIKVGVFDGKIWK